MNTKLKWACCLLPCLLGALALAILAGCEGSSNQDVSGAEEYFEHNPYSSIPRTDPEPQTLDLQPPLYVVSYPNEQVIFTVAGGEGAYHWYVSNPGNGVINSHGANQAVYIVKQVDENSITVEDESGHYAAAYIETSSSTGAVALVISPAAITLQNGEVHASFSVSGGRAPYAWTSGNVALGTISYSAGSSYVAAYTAVAGAYGKNVVTVTDAMGRFASATVTQSP